MGKEREMRRDRPPRPSGPGAESVAWWAGWRSTAGRPAPTGARGGSRAPRPGGRGVEAAPPPADTAGLPPIDHLEGKEAALMAKVAVGVPQEEARWRFTPKGVPVPRMGRRLPDVLLSFLLVAPALILMLVYVLYPFWQIATGAFETQATLSSP